MKGFMVRRVAGRQIFTKFVQEGVKVFLSTLLCSERGAAEVVTAHAGGFAGILILNLGLPTVLALLSQLQLHRLNFFHQLVNVANLTCLGLFQFEKEIAIAL